MELIKPWEDVADQVAAREEPTLKVLVQPGLLIVAAALQEAKETTVEDLYLGITMVEVEVVLDRLPIQPICHISHIPVLGG
jgi:hypothetical protein